MRVAAVKRNWASGRGVISRHMRALTRSLGAPPIGTADAGPRDNAISSVTGLPAIVVPAGVDGDGLPIGMEILGPPFSEPMLIRIAHAYERARGAARLPPATPRLSGDVFSW